MHAADNKIMYDLGLGGSSTVRVAVVHLGLQGVHIHQATIGASGKSTTAFLRSRCATAQSDLIGGLSLGNIYVELSCICSKHSRFVA